MRTVVPPQFTGEDLQRLLAAALTAPPAAGRAEQPRQGAGTEPATAAGGAPDGARTTDPATATDPWDEPW